MKDEIQSVYQCDCPESSEALGMNVDRHSRNRDTHKFTPTVLFRDNQCKYCGHYAMYIGDKNGNQRTCQHKNKAS